MEIAIGVALFVAWVAYRQFVAIPLDRRLAADRELSDRMSENEEAAKVLGRSLEESSAFGETRYRHNVNPGKLTSHHRPKGSTQFSIYVYALHRTDSGAWFQKLVGAETQLFKGNAEGYVDHLQAIELVKYGPEYWAAFREETVAWHPVPRLSPWLESNYQDCVRYYKEHPGYYPGMPIEEYGVVGAHKQSKRVWVPPTHTTDDEVHASARRRETARQKVIAEEQLAWEAERLRREKEPRGS